MLRASSRRQRRLIYDAMLGDHTLFSSAAGIEDLWERSQPRLDNPPPGPAVPAGIMGSERDASAHRTRGLASSVRTDLTEERQPMGEDPLDAASTSAAATACRGCVGLGVVTAGYLVAPAILVVVAVVAPYRQAVVAAETVERARVTEVRKAEFPLQSSPRAVCGSAA